LTFTQPKFLSRFVPVRWLQTPVWSCVCAPGRAAAIAAAPFRMLANQAMLRSGNPVRREPIVRSVAAASRADRSARSFEALCKLYALFCIFALAKGGTRVLWPLTVSLAAERAAPVGGVKDTITL